MYCSKINNHTTDAIIELSMRVTNKKIDSIKQIYNSSYKIIYAPEQVNEFINKQYWLYVCDAANGLDTIIYEIHPDAIRFNNWIAYPASLDYNYKYHLTINRKLFNATSRSILPKDSLSSFLIFVDTNKFIINEFDANPSNIPIDSIEFISWNNSNDSVFIELDRSLCEFIGLYYNFVLFNNKYNYLNTNNWLAKRSNIALPHDNGRSTKSRVIVQNSSNPYEEKSFRP